MILPNELSPEIVDKLLDKLSSDDEFRAVFQKNPRIALAYLGHEGATNAGPKDEGVWACARCDQLASKETISTTRDELQKQLMTSLAVKGVVGLDMANRSS